MLISSSVFIRSNGMLTIIIVGYKILQDFLHNLHNLKRTLINLTMGVFALLVAFFPFFWMQIEPINRFCKLDLLPFCYTSMPSLYSHVQTVWGNGFLKQYLSFNENTHFGYSTAFLVFYSNWNIYKTRGLRLFTFGL
jgi:hypothetical protein